jgi:hypothetical protein
MEAHAAKQQQGGGAGGVCGARDVLRLEPQVCFLLFCFLNSIEST